MKPKPRKVARLRASVYSFADVTVDAEAGVIRNASVMTIGPAAGHGFDLDEISLQQLVAAFAARGGEVKVRFKHPAISESGVADDLGTDVGTISNFRIEGNSVRGDVHIASYAAHLPIYGDVKSYLIAKATEAPESFGLSAVIEYALERVSDDKVVARILDADAVDFVGTPAANPSGLLAAKTTLETIEMEPEFIAFIAAKLGLATDATAESVQDAYDALSPEEQAAIVAEYEAGKVTPPPEPDTSLSEEKPDEEKPASMAAKASGNIIALERKRVSDITALAAVFPKIPQEKLNQAIGLGLTVEQARAAFRQHLATVARPIRSISVGEDRGRANLRASMADSIRIRAGVQVKDASDESRKLASLSLCDQFRQYLIQHGVREATYFSQSRLAELMTSQRKRAQLAQSTADFDNLLLDAANKTLRQAYTEYPTTWNLWARRSTNPDFKAGNRIVLSEIGTPTQRTEGAPFTYNTLTDGKETVTLTEYTTGVRLTRRAIINDDLDAFNRIPAQLGLAFKRLEDNIAYDTLTANAALADTGLLFNSTAVTTAGGHANTASAGAPTVATLATISTLMRRQRGVKGDAYLDVRPKTLIVPVTLEVTASQLVGSNVDPAGTNARMNPYFNALTVVSHPRLDATSTTHWFLAADPNSIDTVEVCFLNDEPEPVLKNETEFDTDDVKFAGRHTIAAKAIDFRGLARNTG
jgi:hypothetical protein